MASKLCKKEAPDGEHDAILKIDALFDGFIGGLAMHGVLAQCERVLVGHGVPDNIHCVPQVVL